MSYRKDFPFFTSDYVYLDSAATSQKPQMVIDAINRYNSKECATVHRTVYDLSLKATEEYENSRKTIADFISCQPEEIIFCKGTTDGINLVARSFGLAFLKAKDTIAITEMEHHSNIVPWQLLAKEKDLQLKVIPVLDDKSLDLSDPDFFKDVKLLAITHISNVTGIENPIKSICQTARLYGTKIVVDGAQAIGHKKVDVKDLDCDFYIFSSHKIYGPTGVGVVYGKKELLEKMPPIAGGGDMIDEVFLTHSTYQKPPMRFEPGTPSIAEVIGLKAAIEYLNSIGFDKIKDHEKMLYSYLLEKLSAIPEVKPFCKLDSSSIFSFTVDEFHPLDIATFLSFKKIAIRSGHLCAQPYLRRFGRTSLCRLSFGIYNNQADIDAFTKAMTQLLFAMK